jgi:serpin B
MRNLTSLILLASLSIGASADSTQKPKSIDRFAAKFHGEAGKTKGNLIYSPMSIGIALAMTREGATGTTAKQMDDVLGKDTGTDAKALRVAMKSSPGAKTDPNTPAPPELAVVNRLFGDSKVTWVKRFLDVTGGEYGAPIEGVDFRKNANGARIKINKWVEEQTKNRIKDLLKPGIVDGLTRLVLVNAIYLKAQWLTPFEVSNTKPADFAVTGAAKVKVPTMHGTVDGSHGTYAGARLVDLPYAAGPKGPRLSMMIVVPDSAKLDAIEATYTKEGLAGFMKSLKGAELQLALPKFKIESEFLLNEALGKLGMPRAFSELEAEFDGMTKDEKLHISKVIHKAFVEVDEKGTEAAAATAVVMATEGAAMHKPIPFKVDRSFAFFIHDASGTVLFAGRVQDPSKK